MELVMAGPGKEKFYTMAYVYCLFSELIPFKLFPAPRLECELHEGRKFSLFHQWLYSKCF